MPPHLRQLFTDAYNYRLKYLEPVRDDRFWDMAAMEMEAIAKKHGYSDLAQTVMMALYADVERELLEAEGQIKEIENRKEWAKHERLFG